MYGRKYMGVERSTFLIDKVVMFSACGARYKVPGHIDQVLEAVGELA